MTLILWLVLAAQDTQSADVSFEKKLLATIPKDLRSTGSIRYSPDGRSVAYVAEDPQDERIKFVMVGDAKGDEFDGIDCPPVFSPDGTALAYVASEGSARFVVVNGRRGESFGSFDRLENRGEPFLFGPDGRTVMYVAKAAGGGKWCMVVGEKKSEPFDKPSNSPTRPTVRPDGRMLWCVAQIGDKYHILVGDHTGPGYASVGDPYWLSDGTLAYWARDDAGPSIVVGDRKGESFGEVGDPVFSRVGHVVAFTARPKENRFAGGMFVVVGEKKGETFETVQSPALSADGEVAAYFGRKDGKWMLVHGDKASEVAGEPFHIAISQDGALVAYAAEIDGSRYVVHGDRKFGKFDTIEELTFGPDGRTLVCKAKRANQTVVVVGDHQSERCVFVHGPLFSPGGKSWAYRAIIEDRRKTFVVINGKRGEVHERHFMDSVPGLFWSPDGAKVAHMERLGEHMCMFLGEEKGKEFFDVGAPVFSRDGRMIAYPVSLGEKQTCMVVGDQIGEPFEKLGPFGTEDDPIWAKFAPDGKTVVYRAYSKYKWTMVVGGKKSEPFDEIWVPVFSPDGKKVAFGARKDRELWWQVMPVE